MDDGWKTSSESNEGLLYCAYSPPIRAIPALPDAQPCFLLVRLSSIGDVVITTAAARELKRHFPGCRIVAAVEEKSEAAVRMNPWVDEIFLFRVKAVKALVRQRKWPQLWEGIREVHDRLKSYRCQAAFDLQGRFRTGWMAWSSGAPMRVGYDGDEGEGGRLFLTHRYIRPAFTRVGEESVYLLRALGITNPDPSLCLQPPPEAYVRAEQFLQRYQIDPSRCIALCPATTCDSKHWLDAGWAVVIDRLQKQHGFQPVFLGGPQDNDRLSRINALADLPIPSLAGMLTLEESTALIDRSALTVAVDTGLAHISIAMNTPVIILHGSTPFFRMKDEPNVTVVFDSRACGARLTGYSCPNCKCTQMITPDAVVEAILYRMNCSNLHAGVLSTPCKA